MKKVRPEDSLAAPIFRPTLRRLILQRLTDAVQVPHFIIHHRDQRLHRDIRQRNELA
jgi:hypothetical protein